MMHAKALISHLRKSMEFWPTIGHETKTYQVTIPQKHEERVSSSGAKMNDFLRRTSTRKWFDKVVILMAALRVYKVYRIHQ